ncbi:MAG: SprB repeat-containing protein, partial [Bacteroidota bacterium]
AIDLSVTGGTPAYTYAWSTGATTQDISGLSAGTYTVTVTDGNNCTTVESFTITEPPVLVASLDGSEDADCNGAATGSIDLMVVGGTGPYTYLWSTGATTQDLTGLNAGTYSVVVTDANGCTDTESFTIGEPTTLEINIAGTVTEDADCNGATTGSIDLAVSGGTAPYTYAWSNNATTQDISDLAAGTYTVTVTDANGCTDSASFIIEEPSTLEIDLVASSKVNVDCNGTAIGIRYGYSISTSC